MLYILIHFMPHVFSHLFFCLVFLSIHDYIHFVFVYLIKRLLQTMKKMAMTILLYLALSSEVLESPCRRLYNIVMPKLQRFQHWKNIFDGNIFIVCMLWIGHNLGKLYNPTLVSIKKMHCIN